MNGVWPEIPPLVDPFNKRRGEVGLVGTQPCGSHHPSMSEQEFWCNTNELGQWATSLANLSGGVGFLLTSSLTGDAGRVCRLASAGLAAPQLER